MVSATGRIAAQISDKIYGKPEDFKELKKRILVVEILEPNPKTIEKLQKKKKQPELLKDYENFFSNYNELIKKVVPQYWKLNEKIEFKTTSEINSIAGNSKYVILTYIELGDVMFLDFYERASAVSVPALLYGRIEKPKKQPDYKIYLPSSYVRKDNLYLESDFIFAIKAIQNNINYIIDNNKVLNFEEYANAVAKNNCSRIQSLNLLIDKTRKAEKLENNEIKENYKGNFRFAPPQELDSAIVNLIKGSAVMFIVPFGILKSTHGQSGPGTLVSWRYAFLKVIVDAETCEILHVFEPGAMLTFFDDKIRKNDFKNIAGCKFK